MNAPLTSIELPAWESYQLLGASRFGRLCVIDHGVPIALPINYLVEENPDGRKAVAVVRPQSVLARYSGPASLEVDEIDAGNAGAWSVIAVGELASPPARSGLPSTSPRAPIDRRHVIELTISSISGRRFTPQPGADAALVVPWQLSYG